MGAKINAPEAYVLAKDNNLMIHTVGLIYLPISLDLRSVDKDMSNSYSSI